MEQAECSAKILSGLEQDHVRIRQVLRVISAELRQMETGGTMDFLLAADALAYMQAFPSRVHHPKEDVLFGYLMLRDPDCGALVAEIREQHQEVYEVERWLKQRVLHRPLPFSVEARGLTDFGREYLRLQRDHIRAEDEILFRRAQEFLKPEDWLQTASSVEVVEDPLFDEPPQELFQRVHDRILRDARRT